MKFITALKISAVCLVALAVEMVLAYFIWSDYAFSLVESGQYTASESYSQGPMKTLARIFYGIFGVTLAVGLGAQVFSLLSLPFSDRSRPQDPSDSPPSPPSSTSGT